MKKKDERTPPVQEPLIARRWVTYEDLRDLGVPMGRNNLRALWENGNFPAPLRPFSRRIVWRADEIEEWLKKKEQERLS